MVMSRLVYHNSAFRGKNELHCCGARAGMVYYSSMHEQSDKFNNPRAGAIGPVLLYILLACALVALFCWRVASTSRQENAPAAAPQTEQ
jgi:hypothetical protein